MNRRLYIDWLRGVAVLCMILWHSVDAWTVVEDRGTTAFGLAGFFGGWAAPLFLFLAGVSLPLAGLKRLSGGAGRRAASWALQKRGWQVFVIAHLFRLQSFLLNPAASWSSLLKPDILNVLGLSIVAVAWCWGRDDRAPRSSVWWLLLPGVIIAVWLTPAMATAAWPTVLHPRLEAYIRPVGNAGVFSLFPAMAYVFLGAFVGSVASRAPETDRRMHLALAAWGGGLVIVGTLIHRLLAYLPAEAGVWIGTAAVVTWKTGVMLIGMVIAWVWLRRHSAPRTPLILLGRHSLFVYWVHVELAYGVFSYPLHKFLRIPWSILACGLFVLALIGATELWARRMRRPLIPPHMSATSEASQGLST